MRGGDIAGLLIRQARLQRDWSQEGLCRGICAPSYLSKIEQGKAAPSPEVTEEQLSDFLTLMSASGRLEPLEEHLIDAGSAVAGCGGAFVSLFLEALADGAVTCGLPRDKARRYAAQMVLGTAQLALQSDQHTAAMKDAVCSPGGTTIAGVRALERGGFRSAAMEAVIAAYEKTLALKS